MVTAAIAVVDVGTSEVKAAVIDRSGTVLGRSQREVVHRGDGGVEIPAEVLLEWPCELLAEAVAAAPQADVKALGVTGARGTILAVDRQDRPLGRAVAWVDGRGARHLGPLADAVGAQRFARLTGLPLGPALSVGTVLRWRAERAPEARAGRYAGAPAVAGHALTGRWATDRTCAGYYGVATIDGRWSEELLDAAALSPGQLPEVLEPGEVIGCVTDKIARAVGVRPGTPVVAAGSDAAAFKVGAGLQDGRAVVVSIGTAVSAGRLLPSAADELDAGFSCQPSAVTGLYDVSGLHPSGGLILRWLRDLGAGLSGTPVGYERLVELARAVPVGSAGVTVLPWLTGAGAPWVAPEATGVISGLRAALGAGHLARAAIEGVACTAAELVERLTPLGGRPDELRLVGGAGRSGLWRQAVCDATDLPVRSSAGDEPALLGAAAITALATGLHPSLDAAIAAMCRAGDRTRPDPSTRLEWMEVRTRFREAADRALEPLNCTPEYERTP